MSAREHACPVWCAREHLPAGHPSVAHHATVTEMQIRGVLVAVVIGSYERVDGLGLAAHISIEVTVDGESAAMDLTRMQSRALAEILALSDDTRWLADSLVVAVDIIEAARNEVTGS